MRHDAAFGAAAGAGGIDDAGGVAAFAWHEDWFGFRVKIFPAMCAGEVGVCWSFGDEYGADGEIFKLPGLCDCAPEVVFDY